MECMVSVCCLAFNHEKYLRQCIEGFVRQKTTFPFEVLIHDDASTDGTTYIILEYQRKYPQIIKPIFQKENQHNKGKRLPDIYREFIYPRVSGKYIAYCEGDDFWKSENKLQMQFEVMESHSECNLCLHKVRTTSEDGKPAKETYPGVPVTEGWIEQDAFLKGLTDGRFFHTSSFMCRTEMIQELCREIPAFYKISYVDDVPLLLYAGVRGGIYYIDEELTCYRRNSIGSWTENREKNINKIIAFKKEIIQMYEYYDLYTEHRFSSVCNHWINSERIRIAEYERDYSEMIKPQYAEFLKNRSLKYRIRVFILGWFQKAMRTYC